jgi:N-acetylmuramoyl-L-alanine amidase CwlA
MDITESLLPKKSMCRPQKKLIGVKGIVLHYTMWPNGSAQQVRDDFALGVRHASAHYIVDPDTILRVLPENEMAYHVGAKEYKLDARQWLSTYPNNCTIGIEMCVNKAMEFEGGTVRNAQALCVDLMKRYSLLPSDLWRHYDVTGKVCPKPYVDREGAWFDFVGAVFALWMAPEKQRTLFDFKSRPGACIPA